MITKQNVLSANKLNRNTYVFLFSVIIACLTLLVVLHFAQDVSYRQLTADPNNLGKLPFYSGILSQIGIFFWSAIITTSLVFAYINRFYRQDKHVRSFFIWSALIVLWLAIDDCFLFHEDVLPSLGIPQKVIVFSYGLMVLVYLYEFKGLILKTPFILLLAAFGCFGLSVFIDFFLHFEGETYIDSLIEDGAKFTGIVLWFAYIFNCKSLVLKEKL